MISALAKHPDVHTVYYGFRERGGKDTLEPCIVCMVEKKIPLSRINRSRIIPGKLSLGGEVYKTDVQESPRMSTRELVLPEDFGEYLGVIENGGIRDWTRCHSPTVPGGAQIAPDGAPWVGTNGVACKLKGRYGALSNWHVLVGGRYGKDHPIRQPDGRHTGTPMGRLSKWVPIKFDGSANYVDCAWQDCQEGDEYVAIPEQIQLGRIEPNPVLNPQLGPSVRKSGRTTKVTRGVVKGVDVESSVSYGEDGIAKFRGQVLVKSESGGDFSGPGDSGSLVVLENNRPLGLLFAGGGGSTIINPIGAVIDRLGIEFF